MDTTHTTVRPCDRSYGYECEFIASLSVPGKNISRFEVYYYQILNLLSQDTALKDFKNKMAIYLHTKKYYKEYYLLYKKSN